MKKGVLVCFTGIDGAGKTSLAKAVVDDLRGQGYDADYLYLRYSPLLLRPVIALSGRTLLRKQDFSRNYSDYSRVKHGFAHEHSLLSSLYQVALLSDYLLQVLVKLYVPLRRGRNIICDRYVFDTVATDLSVDFGLSGPQMLAYLRGLFKVFPRPDLCFFVDIPEEEAFRRKSDIPSVEYLRDRKWAYQLISRSEDMVVLDGLEPLEVLRAEAGRTIQGVLA